MLVRVSISNINSNRFLCKILSFFLVIAPQYVLTAGHCVAFHNNNGSVELFKFFFIQFGQTRMFNNDEWIYRSVDKVILHQNYSSLGTEGSVNDIALLKLNESIVYSETIQPAQLPSKEFLGIPLLTAIGWGMTETGSASNFLLHVIVQGVTPQECQKLLDKESINKVQLHEGMLCATSSVYFPGGGICHGDSGGPLVISGTNILLGLSSWGPETKNCLNKPHPDVFTRITFYLDWIYSKIGEEYMNDLQNAPNEIGQWEGNTAIST